MKITKRRWNKQLTVYLYRHEKHGKLVEADDTSKDRTESVFQEPLVKKAFDDSMRGRLLRVDKSGRNAKADSAITSLVSDLCKNINFTSTSQTLLHTSYTPDMVERKIKETLSDYGKSYAAHNGQMALSKAILTLMTPNAKAAYDSAITTLFDIQEALQKEQSNRIARVRSSIEGNKMPLRVEGDCVKGNTERAKWFLHLLDASKSGGSCYPVLDTMERIADIDGLSRSLTASCETVKDKSREIALAVNKTLREHCQKVWQSCSEEHPEQLNNLRYYFQALHAYFKENFPIRTKNEGARKRQEHLKTPDDLARLLAPNHIEKSIQRAIINKSTQLHILYGKLSEYCTGDNAWAVNSDTLQKIQVIEAVKKQVMTTLSWAIARLNYFCDYYDSDNTAKEILSKGIIDNCLKKEDVVNELPAKLCAFFPIDETEATADNVKTLLNVCADCTRKLRVRIFHFKMLNFADALKDAAGEAFSASNSKQKDLLQQLYQKDRDSLKDVFRQQISSMNLPLYYSAALLNRVFSTDQDHFQLYSDNYPMTPSFRRVYERGNNIVPYVVTMHWYKQNGQAAVDAEACRAMRNLLQLLYYYFFLPAVQSDEALIKTQIPSVLNRNQGLAEKGRNPKAYGYAEIKEFYQPSMPLEKLMIQLQREISQTEQESLEKAQEKKDYAQRFLCDVYAAAFNHYLDNHFIDVYPEMMEPKSGNDTAAEFELPDLHTALPVVPEDYLLVIYPVLRLLDGQELSELQQQMQRYRAYLSKYAASAVQKPSDQIKLIEELIELVKLTEPMQIKAATSWSSVPKELIPFIEGKQEEYEDFYSQSDNMTPVLHRNVMRMQHTGILALYKDKLPKQATPSNYKVIREGKRKIEGNGQLISSIEHHQQELKQLHQAYTESKQHTLSPDNYQSYHSLAVYVHTYNEAMRSMTFSSMYEISRIHVKLASRMVGFAQDWERDMYFLLKAWSLQHRIAVEPKVIDEIFDAGDVRLNLSKKLKNSSLSAFLSIYGNNADRELNFIRVRNGISHLDLLRKQGWNGRYTSTEISVFENYLNRLRKLLYYDTKRMNAVTKAMQKIMQQHKLTLTFSMGKGGKLKIEKIESEHIEHLKNIKNAEPISLPSHNPAFDKALQALMQYHPLKE